MKVEGIENKNKDYSMPTRLRSKTPNPVTNNKNYGALYKNVDYQQHIINYHQVNIRDTIFSLQNKSSLFKKKITKIL